MIYSGAKWIEEGEKPTRYFFNLNKVRGAKKEINVLQSENSQLITGSKEILNYCNSYFRKLYSRSDSSQNNDEKSMVGEFLGSIEIPRLSQSDRDICDEPFTSAECKVALDSMMNNKSPSVSGFSK